MPAMTATAISTGTSAAGPKITLIPLPPGPFGPRLAPAGIAALIAATQVAASDDLSSTAESTPTPDGWVLLPTPTPGALPPHETAAGAIAEIAGQAAEATGEAIGEIAPDPPITEALQLPIDPAPTDPAPAAPAPPPAPTAAVAPTPDGSARSVRLPILMYHYLSVPPPDADRYRIDLSVTPDTFAAHLDAMQQAGYTPISFYTLLAHLNQGAPLPEKPVIITFDDGYRDNYEHALPLLAARGMTATFFIVTDFIDEQRPEYLTWDMVRALYAAGMSVESHGRNHVSLKNKDRDYLIWQALGSMETIQFELGVRPFFVSYPAGEYDDLTIDVFRSAGYWAGVTTVQGATHHSDDLFRMPRVRVRNSTSTDELLRLLALDW
jgi:peptidoglycan/xylan/chitin deacetylase (PgdA/CDA1 family)